MGSQFGIGDIVYQGFISPGKAGKVIWGFGPQLNIPTGMGRMSTNHWSMGPAAVALVMPGHWVIGALVSNVWSIGSGYGNPGDVNDFTLREPREHRATCLALSAAGAFAADAIGEPGPEAGTPNRFASSRIRSRAPARDSPARVIA